jgi:hypothetical protein
MWVKPRVGLKIRDPLTQRHVPDCGIAVEDNTFWRRRMQEGDVSVTNSIPSIDKPKSKSTKENSE